MSTQESLRREFVATTGAATIGAGRTKRHRDRAGQKALRHRRHRRARDRHVGDAHRKRYSDVLDFVGLCDVNPPVLKCLPTHRRVLSDVYQPDEMLDKARPTHLMVTTVDAFHGDCIVVCAPARRQCHH